jgi:hypothetical protein
MLFGRTEAEKREENFEGKRHGLRPFYGKHFFASGDRDYCNNTQQAV